MNVAGTLSYVLTGKEKEIPQRQIDLLQMTFFEWFPQYKFIEEKISDYAEFSKEFKSFEEARSLLLQYLFTPNRD